MRLARWICRNRKTRASLTIDDEFDVHEVEPAEDPITVDTTTVVDLHEAMTIVRPAGPLSLPASPGSVAALTQSASAPGTAGG